MSPCVLLRQALRLLIARRHLQSTLHVLHAPHREPLYLTNIAIILAAHWMHQAVCVELQGHRGLEAGRCEATGLGNGRAARFARR